MRIMRVSSWACDLLLRHLVEALLFLVKRLLFAYIVSSFLITGVVAAVGFTLVSYLETASP